MVQKWAIGTMINISGSIAINLGTNLMKLSHKMKKGEYRQHGDDNTSNNAIRSGLKSSDDDDLEAAEPMINREANDSPRRQQQQQQQQQQQRHFFPSSLRSAKGAQHGVEMTAYPADALVQERGGPGRVPDSEPITNGGARAGGIGKLRGGGAGGSSRDLRGSGEGRGGADEEEMVGLTEESLTDSPSSTTGVSTSSDDRAAQHSRGRKALASSSSSSPAKRPPPKGGQAKGAEPPTGGGEYDARPGVRKRPLSISPNQDGGGEEGFAERGGLEASGGSGGGHGHGSGAWEQQPPPEWMATALWYLGAVLLVAGSLVNFASFGFAPQSLLASLGSVQFISNVVFGKVILREMVTRRIILGTATIILGNTLTLCFSPHQDDNFSTHELKAFYDAEYNTLLLLELAIALAMHAAYKSFKRSKEQGRPRRHSDLVMPLAYAICSAIVGTQSVVNAKCLSELLTLTFRGENQLGSIFTYLVFAIWLGTTIFWLVRMNRALAMFHGLFIIPALQVFWTFFSVIDGGFYFEEFHTLHVLGGLGFAVGVLVVFCGVYLLAPRTQTDHGRHAGVGGGGEAAGESDGEESDLRRMLRLEGVCVRGA
ncbi:unnamed protein product [Ectocarpus sp. CCAP 1310/34]|nr:unnamed protein product [Ectocarpus sp. CCAP 1310/34]